MHNYLLLRPQSPCCFGTVRASVFPDARFSAQSDEACTSIDLCAIVMPARGVELPRSRQVQRVANRASVAQPVVDSLWA